MTDDANTLTLRKRSAQLGDGATRYDALVDGSRRSMSVVRYTDAHRRLMGEPGRWVCRWTDWHGNLRTTSADTAAELGAALAFSRVRFVRATGSL